jgi:hypothetical protein
MTKSPQAVIPMSQTLLKEIIMRHTCFKPTLSAQALGALLAVLLTVGLTPSLAGAQVLYGSLVGNVADQNGAVVAGATVTIIDKKTGLTRETASREDGDYSITNILPGAYELKVTKQGFSSFSKTEMVITANNVTRADVQMKIGNVSDVVSVTADATALQTETATVKSELSGKEINAVPLARFRNYQSLLNLVPGTTPALFQNANTDSPARSLTTNVNGTARNNNNTRLDGAQNVFIWLPHHAVYVAPSETIQEVNVSTNNFDAEQGLAGGAAINVVTKSGTNEFHGSGFVHHDNNIFRAKNYFQRTDLGRNTPKYLDTIAGATLGGPIKKDKLFFFGGYEGTFERITRQNTFTVPTADQRAGNFSAYPNTTIFDPTTGAIDGTGRTQFTNNIIPAGKINPISQKIQALIPLPNLPGVTNNFFNSAPQILDRHNFDGKVNWNRTAKHQIWGKFSNMRANVTGSFSLNQAGGVCLCEGGNGTGDTKVYLATLGQTYTVSSNFIIDGVFGFTRMNHVTHGPDFGKNIGSEVLGIPGTNGPDIRQSGFPQFNIANYAALGNQDNWSPVTRNDQSFTGNVNATKIQKNHEIRFGFDVVRHELNHWQPEIGAGPRGRFNFGAAVTSAPGGSENQFNAYAGFLLGLPASAEKSLQYEVMTGREWQMGFFARDRWQVTRKLTATLGLRYELFPLMHRADRGIELLNLNSPVRLNAAGQPDGTMEVLLGGRGGNESDLGIETSKKLFAPRIGLAYRLGDNTVIRSGYGLTYDPMPFARPLRGFYPLTIAQTFVNPDPKSNARTPFQPLDQGIPPFTGPDLSTGKVLLPGTVNMRSPYADRIHRGYIQSWNLFVERRLPSDFILDVGYVGTQTTHQLNTLNINAAPSPGLGRNGQPLFARYGRSTTTFLWDGFTSANYHALQVALNRRLARGLFVKAAYTWSKAINMVDDTGTDGLPLFNAPSQIIRNRALAGYDIPHNIQFGFAAEFPFGKGKKWAQDGLAGALLGNWQVNGVLSLVSGRPFTVTASDTSLNSPGNSQTADQVKSKVEKLGGIGTTVPGVPDQPYFDKTAFANVTAVRYGTTGRNILRGPGLENLDLSLFRVFSLTERFKIEFRAESFNFTNTPHFNNPNSSVTASNFMVITSTNANFPERQFRFGARLTF